MKKSILRATRFAAIAAIIAVGCGDEGVQNKNPEVGEFINMIVGGGGDNGGGEKRYSLSVGVSPIGSGSVSRKPDSASYKAGSTVAVTASAASGYKFTGWSGASGDVTATVTVTMNSDVSMTANFISTAVTTHTLTVNATPSGGGNVSRKPNKTLYTAGEEVTVTAEPANGYTFAGWTGAVNKSDKSVTVTMNGDITLNANFQPLTYTLSVNANPTQGGTVSRDPQKTAYTYGESVTVTAAPANGYAFDGYSGAVTSTSAGVTIIIDGNKTLTANFKQQTAPSYTLSTPVNQALGTVTRSPDKASYTQGETVTVTAAPASGSTFTGWSGAATGTTNPVTIVMDDDKTLTATFQQVTYAVIWNADGGTPAPTQTSVNHGGSINQPATTIAKTGYTFDGWYTNSGLTTKATFPITDVTTVTTLYAKWTAVPTYAVTVTSAGTGATGAGSYASGATVNITAGTAPSGQRFKNWTTASNGVTIANPNNASTSFTMPANNVTVTANFEAQTATSTTYAVTVSGGTGGGNYAAGATVSITAGAAPTGQKFKNWTSTSNGVTFVNANNTSTSFTMPANNVTVTANFEAITYTVTFNGNGATSGVPSTVSVNSGGSATLPDMTRIGYTFGGWYENSGCTGTGYAAGSSYTVTGNVTLYAKWTLITYTVTFNANGGTVSTASGTTGVGGKLASLPTPTFTQSGYTFNGWYTAETGGTQVTTSTVFDANTTVYAQWTLNTYTVTFNPNNGTVSPTSGTTGVGGKLASLPTPTRSDYTFKGWYTATTGGTEVTLDRVYTVNTTIYAQWTPITYNITYNLDNGTLSSANPASYTVETATFTLKNPTKTGYTFTGWTGSNGTSPQTTVSVAKGSTGDKSYTANFEGIRYTVTVTSAGTGATGTGSYTTGTTVSISAGTTPAGWVFKNWTSSNSSVIFANENNAATTFVMPGSAVTVTAVFEYSGYDVSLSCGDRACRTVDIGGKTWMAENLNYQTLSDSWCYNNSPDSCAKYGRLYTWEAAKSACPSGWHLPSRSEWGDLAKAAGGTNDYGTGGAAGKKLKSTGGWYKNGNGTDDYGFSALPGGYRYSDGDFNYAGYGGYWWAATENGSGHAYYRGMDGSYDYVGEYGYYKSGGHSVRCVQD